MVREAESDALERTLPDVGELATSAITSTEPARAVARAQADPTVRGADDYAILALIATLAEIPLDIQVRSAAATRPSRVAHTRRDSSRIRAHTRRRPHRCSHPRPTHAQRHPQPSDHRARTRLRPTGLTPAADVTPDRRHCSGPHAAPRAQTDPPRRTRAGRPCQQQRPHGRQGRRHSASSTISTSLLPKASTTCWQTRRTSSSSTSRLSLCLATLPRYRQHSVTKRSRDQTPQQIA